MKRFIDEIKLKPAADRKRIALTVTFAIALFLILILFLDMREEFSAGSGNNAWKSKFQNLKAEVIGVFQSY